MYTHNLNCVRAAIAKESRILKRREEMIIKNSNTSRPGEVLQAVITANRTSVCITVCNRKHSIEMTRISRRHLDPHTAIYHACQECALPLPLYAHHGCETEGCAS